eukprot:Skav202404  [mRNA]  locus=scaffold815:460933:461487:+ [translate_table: standard]
MVNHQRFSSGQVGGGLPPEPSQEGNRLAATFKETRGQNGGLMLPAHHGLPVNMSQSEAAGSLTWAMLFAILLPWDVDQFACLESTLQDLQPVRHLGSQFVPSFLLRGALAIVRTTSTNVGSTFLETFWATFNTATPEQNSSNLLVIIPHFSHIHLRKSVGLQRHHGVFVCGRTVAEAFDPWLKI